MHRNNVLIIGPNPGPGEPSLPFARESTSYKRLTKMFHKEAHLCADFINLIDNNVFNPERDMWMYRNMAKNKAVYLIMSRYKKVVLLGKYVQYAFSDPIKPFVEPAPFVEFKKAGKLIDVKATIYTSLNTCDSEPLWSLPETFTTASAFFKEVLHV